MLIVVTGPAGCGKSKNAKRIADIFEIPHTNIHDGQNSNSWSAMSPLIDAEDKHLVLTNVPPGEQLFAVSDKAFCVQYKDLAL